MTATTRAKIEQAIRECDTFIAKEERRADDLRPARVAELLASWRSHRAMLVGRLAAGV